MKPKLLLCLALILSGGWLGCATVRQSNATIGGLICYISLPSPKLKPDGTIQAVLVLTNESSQPIPVCTLCQGWRSEIPSQGKFDVTFTPAFWKSDAPHIQDLSNSITTLRKGEGVQLPFEIYDGGNSKLQTIQIGARYRVPENSHEYGLEYEKLNMWRGIIEANPVTITIEP